MKTMKHFAQTAPLVLGAVLALASVLGTAAPATAGGRTTVKLALYPPADSPLPKASGSVKLTLDSYSSLDRVWVSNLAPNTSYFMPVAYYDDRSGEWIVTPLQFQTDQRGNWNGSPGWLIEVYWEWDGTYYLPTFQVFDSATHTLVLTSSP